MNCWWFILKIVNPVFLSFLHVPIVHGNFQKMHWSFKSNLPTMHYEQYRKCSTFIILNCYWFILITLSWQTRFLSLPRNDPQRHHGLFKRLKSVSNRRQSAVNQITNNWFQPTGYSFAFDGPSWPIPLASAEIFNLCFINSEHQFENRL